MTQQFDPRRGWTSASDALFDSLCQGRHLAQSGLPEEPPSDYSESGELIHGALAGQYDPQKLELTEREMFDSCQQIEQRIAVEYFGDNPPLPVRSIRETPDGKTRLWLVFSKDGKQYQHSGQPDVIHRCGTRALICEYKTGINEVAESSSNLQLRDQAVLVYGNHTLLEEIATVVIQPLVTHEPQICVYDKEALQRAQIELYERIVASNTPGLPRTAGKAQCDFCRAKKLCVEYQKFAGALTPPAMLNLLEVAMSAWTPEQCATAAGALAPAYNLLDEVKAFLKLHVPPGWRLKPGAKRESINDPQKCFERFALVGGSLEQFMKAVKVEKGKLKQVVAEASGQKGKALDKSMAALTDGIVDVKQNEPSLEKEEL